MIVSASGADLIPRLQALLGPDQVLFAPADLIPYGFDGTAELNQLPGCVAFPADAEEVADCLKLAREYGVPVVTRGSGTGLSGGSVPMEGALVLCLLRLNRILAVDPENLTLTAQCGVITQSIDETAARHGLFYPPDPGSLKIATIGGNVAENSGGLRGLKYGVTRDYVMGMEVVLPDGSIAHLGSACVKDVAGYSLRDLFIGSEGTLGVITEVLLKLIPRPAARRTLLAAFPTMEAAADTVSAIIAARIIPCTLEFLDQVTLRCVEDYAKVGLPIEAGAVLLMETDGHPAAVEDEAGAMERLARECGADSVRVARNAEEAAELATARRQAFSALARIRPTTILEDVTVPRNRLSEMVRFIEATAKRHDLLIGTFGHMGDGNLHPTFLTDEKNRDEMERVHAALGDVVRKTIELGGTVTGEHGVGLAKKAYLRSQFDDASYRLLRDVKRTLDPAGLLNPGKIFDLED